MRRKEVIVLTACLVALISATVQAGIDPNSGSPEYVFTAVNANGWIDAGSSPDYHDYSYSFKNLKDSTHPAAWLTTGLTGANNNGEMRFRFKAPEGKMIDELQLGLHGWHDLDSNPANWYYYLVIVQANGELTLQLGEPGGEFYVDAGAVLEPTPELEVWIQTLNYGGAGSETEIYETWLAPGNDYEFAVHVIDEPESDGLVELAPDGSFDLQGPVGQFSDWARNNFNADGLDTWTIGYTVTMPRTYSRTEAMPIRFQLPEGRVYETARLDYSSQIYGYGSNYGYVQLDVITDEDTTKIYYHQSPDYAGQPDSMNYTPEGGVANTGAPFQRAFTDISDLVAGKNAYVLQITVSTGWSGHLYNGGIFLPGRNDLLDLEAGELDFYFTGTTTEGSLPPEPDPCEFVIRGLVDDFVDWAKGFGATGDMQTFNYFGTWYSGGDNNEGFGQVVSLSIPFAFPRPLVDARMEYGSTLSGYASNNGFCQIDLTTADGITQIYYHQSPDAAPGQPDSMNYTPDGGVPNTGNGAYRVYTDIDDLVSGKTAFTLDITCGIGWSSWLYNGAQFLPSAWGLLGDSDFILSGHVVPGPDFCGDDNTYYVEADISGPAGTSDCVVNLYDLAAMTNQWLSCSTPGDSGCTQHWQW